MTANPLTDEILNELGEQFVARLRQGEEPAVEEYSGRFAPEQAAEVEEFLESIAMLEELKRGKETSVKRSTVLPEVFGRYRIEGSLGEGGMGTVYLAHDSQLNRKVALKTPKFSKTDADPIKRFYREARSAATLHHPNICPIFEVGEINGIHYLSMAYVEGRPLSDFIQPQGHPAVGGAVSVVRKIALALHAAHRKGVVHRDLKPANIMIGRHDEPVVMDFGLARQFGDEDDDDPQPMSSAAPQKIEARLTQDGVLLGSPGYMAPEQFTGPRSAIGPATDVYALGVLLFELLTGELPFPNADGNLMSIVADVMNKPPPDPCMLRPDLHPSVGEICQRALAKKPADRFESMEQFAAELTGALKLNAASDRLASAGESNSAQETQVAHNTIAEPATGLGAPPRWFYLVISAPILAIGLLLSVMLFRSIRDQRPNPQPQAVASQTETVAANSEGNETANDEPAGGDEGEGSAAAASGNQPFNRELFIQRLKRFDLNRDGFVARGELARRAPRYPFRRILDNFGAFDLPPRDGKLDEFEIQRLARLMDRFRNQER